MTGLDITHMGRAVVSGVAAAVVLAAAVVAPVLFREVAYVVVMAAAVALFVAGCITVGSGYVSARGVRR